MRVGSQTESVASTHGLVAELGRDSGRPRVVDLTTCDRLGPSAAALLWAWAAYDGAVRINPTLAPDDAVGYGLAPGVGGPAAASRLPVEPAPRNLAAAFGQIAAFWESAVAERGARAANASGELAVNAARHGGRGSGAFMAAGLSTVADRKVAVFATVNLGESIPDRVRAYLGRDLDDKTAVLWAATPGKSTWRRDDEASRRSPSGLGLPEAQKRARSLGARVEILTGAVVLTLDDHARVTPAPVRIPGTLARLVVPLP